MKTNCSPIPIRMLARTQAFEHGHVPRDGGNRLLKPKRAKLNSSASAVPSQSLLYHRRDKELPRQLTPTCRDLSGDTPSKELITPDKISAESRQPKETNGTCGWTPPPGTKTAQYTEAAQHWRKCRGEKTPQAPKEQKLAVLAQAGQTAAQIAKGSAEASWTTSTKEISEKHPQLASSICQPNFDVPFYSPKWGASSHAKFVVNRGDSIA